MSLNAVVIPAGAGPHAEFALGNQLELKAARESGLGFGFFVSQLPVGGGMPFLHLHRRHDEAFYVVAGSIEYRLGERDVVAAAGAGVLIPANVPHCFRALEPARLVVMGSPADAVDMVFDLVQARPDQRSMAELLARYDSVLLEERPHWPASA